MLMVRDEMSNLYRGFLSSFGSFGQAVSEKIFFNRPIRNKNCLWWPCLLADQVEISTICRGPSIDASYQVSVYLSKWFQRRRFLEIDQSETRIACGADLGSITCKCNRLHYNYFAIFMITLHYDYINFQM